MSSITPRRIVLLLAVIQVFQIALLAQRQPATTRSNIDWNQAREETITHLRNLIKFDTTNPPGNETAAANYLKKVLNEAGIEAEVLESAPGRGNLVARIRGNGTKRPILLFSHLDVVGVEREQWTVDPFAGVIKDGFLYGRGAADNKGLAAAELEVMLLLARSKVKLSRDVIFCSVADEESDAEAGAQWMLANHFDKIDAEFAFNEGGRIVIKDDKVQFVGLQTTEKRPYNLCLIADGTSAHASVPRPDNALFALAAAIEEIRQYEPPVRLNETTRKFFQEIARLESAPHSFYLSHIEDPTIGPLCAKKVAEDLSFNAVMRDTISPTILRAGIRSNVIPATAEANLNCRLLPDTDIEAFVAEIKRVIDNDKIRIVYNKSSRPRAPVSSHETDAFKTAARVVETFYPGVPTIPIMGTGATDSAFLRERGIQSYGISPFPERQSSHAHGNDERLSIEGIGRGVQLLYNIVVELAK